MNVFYVTMKSVSITFSKAFGNNDSGRSVEKGARLETGRS